MSDLTLRKCNICLSEYIPLDQVVFFQCGMFNFHSLGPKVHQSLGHNACRSCSEQRSYRDDPSCAECRKPKGLPHRVYLSSDDLVDEPASHIIDNLNGINADYSAERIASASRKIRKLNDSMDRGNLDISVRYIVLYSEMNSCFYSIVESIARRGKGPRRESRPPRCSL